MEKNRFFQNPRLEYPLNEPADQQTNQELLKNRRSNFSVGPTVYVQSNRRKNGFAKSRSVLIPVNLVGFPSVRPKMIGWLDGKIRPPVFGRYEGWLRLVG